MRIGDPALFGLAVAGVLLLCAAVLAVLHRAPNQAKRALIVALTFAGGLFYFLEFFIPPDPARKEAFLGTWNLTQSAVVVGRAIQVVAGFTFLLGVFNLIRIHGNNIRRLRAGWSYSAWFFAALFAMALSGFWRDWSTWFGGPPPPLWVKDTSPANAALPHDLYTFLFEGFYRNLDATMFSILAFYIASAAYRAFRVRSGEAAVLMVVALVLMLGQVPLGMALTSWIPADRPVAGVDWSILRIENFSQYVLTAINGPVQRAIGFGLGLGLLAMSLRIWLSLERGTFFSEE